MYGQALQEYAEYGFVAMNTEYAREFWDLLYRYYPAVARRTERVTQGEFTVFRFSGTMKQLHDLLIYG